MRHRVGYQRPLAQEKECAGRAGGKPQERGADADQRGVVAGLKQKGAEERVHETVSAIASSSIWVAASRPP